MEDLFITPITPLQFQKGTGITENDKAETGTIVQSFGDVFRSLVSEAAEAERNFDEQKYLMASGQVESAHDLTIAGSYAQLTIDMVVNLRNKALEAYNELMRLSI